MTASTASTLPMITTFLNLLVFGLVIATTYPMRKQINEIQEAQEHQHDVIHILMGRVNELLDRERKRL